MSQPSIDTRYAVPNGLRVGALTLFATSVILATQLIVADFMVGVDFGLFGLLTGNASSSSQLPELLSIATLLLPVFMFFAFQSAVAIMKIRNTEAATRNKVLALILGASLLSSLLSLGSTFILLGSLPDFLALLLGLFLLQSVGVALAVWKKTVGWGVLLLLYASSLTLIGIMLWFMYQFFETWFL